MITVDEVREAGKGGTVPLGQHSWRVVSGEDLAQLKVGLTWRVRHWPSILRDMGFVPTTTTFFFECLCSDSGEGVEEEGPINICITPRRKRKRFYILQLTIIHN